MTKTQTTLEEYKKAVRAKYEKEKLGNYSSFLLSPSRAKLRQLCLERIKDTINQDDLRSFSLFLGFEFSLSNLNKLKSQNDKFRPIETFLKGETDLTDIEGVNIAALLVDFNPRPFNKFSKKASENQFEIEEDVNYLSKEISELKSSVDFEKEKEVTENFQLMDDIQSKDVAAKNDSVEKNKEKPKMSIRKKIAVGVSVLATVFSVGYTTKHFISPEKQCMLWNQDHYEMVDCQKEQLGFANLSKTKPYSEIEFNRKKLKVCDTTTFFTANNLPIVWYSKQNNLVEFFNMDGDHPVTSCELKRVTQHMIDKYVKPCD